LERYFRIESPRLADSRSYASCQGIGSDDQRSTGCETSFEHVAVGLVTAIVVASAPLRRDGDHPRLVVAALPGRAAVDVDTTRPAWTQCREIGTGVCCTTV
jgi:hypothetical protein